jgi:hypothetical protein
MERYCLRCNRPETAIPLVALRYNGKETWVCPQCMPVLIHHSERLMDQLGAIEPIAPAPHE